MAEFYVKVGDGARFSKTVGEYDVYSFAGITGDFSPNHVDKSYMEKSSYGRLQAHGALMVGYMSTASTLAIAQHARQRRRDAGVARLRPHPLPRPRSTSATPSPSNTASPRSTSSAAARLASIDDQEPGRRAGHGRHSYPEVGQERQK